MPRMTTPPPLPRMPRLRPAKSAEEAAAVARAKRTREAIALEHLGPPPEQRDYWRMHAETDLDALVRRTALALGYFPYHTRYSIRSEAGFPDWVLVAPRRLVIAECKREGDLPRPGHFGARGRWVPGQDEWLARLWFSRPVHDGLSHEVYLWWPSDGRDIAEILQTGPRPDMPCVRRTAIIATEASETFPDD